jgi:hypothetical protein
MKRVKRKKWDVQKLQENKDLMPLNLLHCKSGSRKAPVLYDIRVKMHILFTETLIAPPLVRHSTYVTVISTVCYRIVGELSITDSDGSTGSTIYIIEY